MTRPAVVFPDPMLATLGVVRASPALSELHFGTRLPEDFAPDDSPSLPYAVVRHDATSGRYPVSETATVRVTVWAATEFDAGRLAQRVRGVLLAFPGSSTVRGFGEGVGPAPSTDPESGSPLSSFTVAARLRPSPM